MNILEIEHNCQKCNSKQQYFISYLNDGDDIVIWGYGISPAQSKKDASE